MSETSTTPRTLRVEFDPVDNEPAAVYDVIITAPDGTIVAMRSFTEADVQNGRVRADIGGLDPDLTYTIDLRVTTPEGTFPLDTMMRSPPDTNECISGPCGNGGTCQQPFINMFRCACTPQFTGLTCQIQSIDPLTQSSAFTTRPVTTTEPKAPINYTIYIVMAAVVLLLILVICFLLCYVKKIKRPASSQNDTRNETTAAGERRSDGGQLDHAYDYPSVELRPLPSTQASIQYGTRIERTDDGKDRSDEGQLDHTYAEQPYMDII
eukprot:XP_011681925.1 PREDICTED: uncharacterized protein LOC105446608 [Strongylocentrotus purpuratus]